jgi:hypothetical protein
MTNAPVAKDEIKKKANELRKTLAKLDQMTGQAFVVAKRADVAQFCDVSLTAIDKWLVMGMPGGRGHYDLHKIIVWLRTEGPWRPLGGNRGTAEDLDDEGPESEWSEEYRKWKAHSAKVSYQKDVGRLISVDEGSHIFHDIIFPEIREFAERVIKAHGNGTADDWSETCERIDAAITAEFDRLEREQQDANGDGDEESPDSRTPDSSDGSQVLDGDDSPPAAEPSVEAERVGGEED